MARDVIAYFEDCVIPIIEDRHPDVARAMAIQIRGSYGLGIADDFSDLDAILWLDDSLWRDKGGHVQLMLENDIPRFSPAAVLAEYGHADVNVWPLSWLGARKHFLNGASDMPWEQVSFEDLFEIQNNLVLRDPEDIFKRLRQATKPESFPQVLWKKRLIHNLKRLDDDIMEYRQVVRRGRKLEQTIIAGRLLQGLFHTGFLILHEYWPWATHLHWAFSRLPAPACEVLPDLERLSGSSGHDEHLSTVQKVKEAYVSAILDSRQLSPQILDDLVWAEKLEAWSKDNWHEWIDDCQRRATAAGRETKDFWIWSLWGWK